jgi:hypothetical protein
MFSSGGEERSVPQGAYDRAELYIRAYSIVVR